MLTAVVRGVLGKLGLDLRRAPDPSLPFIHEIDFDGRPLRLWIANPHTKRWWYRPTFDMNAEARSLKDMCKPGSTVLEVGAHHGIYTIPMAWWVGETGHVHAFEANAENCLVLHANVALNRVTNCTCTHAAGAAKTGFLSMSGETVGQDRPAAMKVTALSLDDYAARCGIERVDLLKVDVEGFEAEVLRGARHILAARPSIALEVHLDDIPRYGSSVQEVLSFLDLGSYEVDLMARTVDWKTLTRIRSADDLPRSGVVNLFMRPRDGVSG